MRSREEILKDGKRIDLLTLEVLLDIRDHFIGEVKPQAPLPTTERKKRRKKRKYTRKVNKDSSSKS